MDIELQIVLISILAMIGIIGVPLYVMWMVWRKSGDAKHALEEEHRHQHS
ncbi:hypothetical protein LV476_03825 [Guyparkeria hydrothermalis]|nr:hypothetical protein [Guyparkeria hydrothermalis]MCL7744081.1 hypothetical protein [Guyparkeria hydrothermalis]